MQRYPVALLMKSLLESSGLYDEFIQINETTINTKLTFLPVFPSVVTTSYFKLTTLQRAAANMLKHLKLKYILNTETTRNANPQANNSLKTKHCIIISWL